MKRRMYLRCSCGGKCYIRRGYSMDDTALAHDMNYIRRVRDCDKCGVPMVTNEVSAADLADLRRKAYLYEMEIGSASEARNVRR